MSAPYTIQDLMRFYHFVVDCCEMSKWQSVAENNDDMDIVDEADGEYADAKERAHRNFMLLPEEMIITTRHLYDMAMGGDF